jgi:hypothetical protein
MPRSGSTLQYQLAVAVVERAGKGSGIGWIEHARCQELRDANSTGEMQVLKMHRFDQLEGTNEAIAEGWATCLYVYRDIRDVAVSLMNKEGISFRQLVLSQYLSTILQEFYNWTSVERILVSQYEALIDDLPQEVLRIASHLSIWLSPEDAQTIADEYTLEKQKKRIEALRNQSQEYDCDRILHANHIHSGASQRWKTHLKPLQIGYLEHMGYNWLRSQNYSLSQAFYYRWAGRVLPWWYRQRSLPGWGGRFARGIAHLRQGTLIAALRYKWRSFQAQRSITDQNSLHRHQ